jgi:hypothetical protein
LLPLSSVSARNFFISSGQHLLRAQIFFSLSGRFNSAGEPAIPFYFFYLLLTAVQACLDAMQS